MTLTSKYELNQKVYVIRNNGIKEVTIIAIRMNKTQYSTTITYDCTELAGSPIKPENEHKLFSTRQEAGEVWMKENGLEVGLK